MLLGEIPQHIETLLDRVKCNPEGVVHIPVATFLSTSQPLC